MPVELNQVTSITDFLQIDHFTFEVPVMPGGGNTKSLTIRNLSAVLPGTGNQVVSAELHRFTIQRAGKPIYGKQFTARMLITKRSDIDDLENWRALNSDPESGLPRPAKEYMTDAMCILYDMDNKPVERRTYKNLWIGNIAEVQLDGSTPGPLIFNVTFVYDYFKRL